MLRCIYCGTRVGRATIAPIAVLVAALPALSLAVAGQSNPEHHATSVSDTVTIIEQDQSSTQLSVQEVGGAYSEVIDNTVDTIERRLIKILSDAAEEESGEEEVYATVEEEVDALFEEVVGVGMTEIVDPIGVFLTPVR